MWIGIEKSYIFVWIKIRIGIEKIVLFILELGLGLKKIFFWIGIMNGIWIEKIFLFGLGLGLGLGLKK